MDEGGPRWRRQPRGQRSLHSQRAELALLPSSQHKKNPDIEPGKSPAQWVPYHTTDPKKAKPFIQPTMAEDSYQKGEVCLWTDGKVYRSIKEDANAYSPEAYPQGWEVVEIEDGGAA